MAGTLTISTLSDGTNSTSSTNCIKGSAKAWVNFDGTTSPGTIRAQYNVSSVTRNSTGDYTMNFTTAMSDANFSAVTAGVGISPSSNTVSGGTYQGPGVDTFTTTSVRVTTGSNAGNYADWPIVNVAVFR